MNEIKVQNLKKRFHNKLVLDIPQLNVNAGEIVSIVGINGAGKSTLIKIISGLLLQDEGSVEVYEHLNNSALIHQDVKFVLESGRGYYEYLSANQNIDYFLHLNGISRSQVKNDLEYLIDKLDFRSHMDKLVSELSQGTRQKLSLIIALLCKPKVLCLDEPTNGLDVVAKRQFAKLLQELSQEKGTIILMTTHDVFFVKEVSTSICVLSKGEIKKKGSFYDVFGDNHNWIKYRIGIDDHALPLLEKRYPNMKYQSEDNCILLETKDIQIKNDILRHFDVVFYEEIQESIEEILFEVLNND